MKLTTLPDERFSCASCTNCCRNWHVELSDSEIDRIPKLAWPASDPLAGQSVLLRHGGKTFLAHRAEGACIFLNQSNGRCRIHEQFGLGAKPLGCQLYPFQIHPISPGEATVSARYDCPAVRRNEGEPHEAALPELRELAGKIKVRQRFDDADNGPLDSDQITSIGEFVATLLGAFDRDADRAMFINAVANWLATQEANKIDRESLAAIFPTLREYVLSAPRPARRPGLIQRMAFRTLLGLYLRRDEDVLDCRAGRAGRLVAMVRLVLTGNVNLRSLGTDHPPAWLRAAKLFTPAMKAGSADVYALHWRMVRNKLLATHYMGSANAHRQIVSGLRSLAMLYPLVAAVAKYNAVSRSSSFIELVDVDRAVAAVEHSFGRQAAAIQPTVQTLENVLGDPEAFARLVLTI